MQPVQVGIIGLGNVGAGALDILAENARDIALKLGFPLEVRAVCSRGDRPQDHLPRPSPPRCKTANWREVVEHPDIDIVAELVGGTGVAREIVEAAIARGKSVVTANKELMALAGADLWDRAIASRINLAMEASVAGGIPIHAVLREGISGDRIDDALRDSQRHLQLHPDRDRKPRRELPRRARRSAAGRLRRGRSLRRR